MVLGFHYVQLKNEISFPPLTLAQALSDNNSLLKPVSNGGILRYRLWQVNHLDTIRHGLSSLYHTIFWCGMRLNK
jgi:hypothetical protein